MSRDMMSRDIYCGIYFGKINFFLYPPLAALKWSSELTINNRCFASQKLFPTHPHTHTQTQHENCGTCTSPTNTGG